MYQTIDKKRMKQFLKNTISYILLQLDSNTQKPEWQQSWLSSWGNQHHQLKPFRYLVWQKATFNDRLEAMKWNYQVTRSTLTVGNNLSQRVFETLVLGAKNVVHHHPQRRLIRGTMNGHFWLICVWFLFLFDRKTDFRDGCCEIHTFGHEKILRLKLNPSCHLTDAQKIQQNWSDLEFWHVLSCILNLILLPFSGSVF